MKLRDPAGLSAYHISSAAIEKYQKAMLEDDINHKDDPEVVMAAKQIRVVMDLWAKMDANDVDNMNTIEKKWARAFDAIYVIYKEYLDIGESRTISANALIELDMKQMYQPVAFRCIKYRHRDAVRQIRSSKTINITDMEWRQQCFDRSWILLDNLEMAQNLIIDAKTNGKTRYAELYELRLKCGNLEDIRLDMELSKSHFRKVISGAINYAVEYHNNVL